jgi:predicted TIM-barrel fold metal-dependent hydrolase
MIIVDSQVHVWCEETPERPWIPSGREIVHLPAPITYGDLIVRMDEAAVDRAVLVPPSWQGDSIDYCLEAAAHHPKRFGVAGRLPIQLPEARQHVKGWMAQRGILGIRLTFHTPQDRNWITDGTADWFWPEAERLGIPVMVHAPHVRERLAEIAAQHTDLRLILDHMGLGRETRDGGVGPALAQTLALARYPNVAVKVSMVPYFSTAPYPYRNIHDDIRRVISTFGPRRCFWGSDLSLLLSATTCDYPQAVKMFTDEFNFLSDEDKSWIMGRGITEWLRWHI